MNVPLFSASNLVKRFDDSAECVLAVNQVSFTANQGEFIALMGPSGCGKSTLLGLLAGLVSPTEGTVDILNVTLNDLTNANLARFRLATLGLVFQEHNLIDEFTALENIKLPLEALGFRGAEADDLATRAIGQVALESLGNRFPSQLSGGQKQRVGIARALVGHKRIIFADEPTGSLDSRNSALTFEILRGLTRQGVCVIVATHDDLVVGYATRVIKMRDGQIVEDSQLRPPGTGH